MKKALWHPMSSLSLSPSRVVLKYFPIAHRTRSAVLSARPVEKFIEAFHERVIAAVARDQPGEILMCIERPLGAATFVKIRIVPGVWPAPRGIEWLRPFPIRSLRCETFQILAGSKRFSVTLVGEPLHAAECNVINSLADGAEAVAAANHPHEVCFHNFGDTAKGAKAAKDPAARRPFSHTDGRRVTGRNHALRRSF